MSGRESAGGRRLALAGLWLFAISSAFPVVAGVTEYARSTRWVGWLDVAFAAALFLCSAAVERHERGRVDDACLLAACRVYRLLAHLPLVLVALFLALGNRIDWTMMMVGLGWRTWLFCYVLPSGIAGLGASSRAGARAGS